MARRPAAYLRKSKDAATKAEHLARLMATVHDDGHNGDTETYDDWARSGDIAKLGLRTEWRRLCDDIEAGRIGIVYMNDLDRGGRSLEEWLRFIRIAREHDVRVVAGGTDYSAPENKDRLIFEAWLAERELDAAKRRAAETIRMRKKRGDAIGGTPYGWKFAKDENGVVIRVEDPDRPVQPILDAIRDAGGNVGEAVRLLNDRGVPSRFGKQWSDAALRGALKRLGAMPPATKKARRTRNGLRKPSPLSKLVVCHCGQVMTPVDSRGELYCYVGSREGAARHGKTKTTQRRVFDFLRSEVPKKMHIPVTFVGSDDSAARRAALEEELRRLGRAYRAGAVNDDEFDSESDRIGRELDDLREAGEWGDATIGEPYRVVDFDGEPERLGEALRRRIVRVELDAEGGLRHIEWRGAAPEEDRKARAGRVAARRARPVTEGQRKRVKEASGTS